MKAFTLYLDSSVLGGYFDEEFAEPTGELWRQKELGLFEFFTSSIVRAEIEAAPGNVRNLFLDTFNRTTDLIDFDEEMADLAGAYLGRRIVTPQFADDARHVAVCTISRLDFLVSWNFRHLVNVTREKSFSSINLLQGYQPIRIVSPLELIYGHESEEI